MLIKITHLSNEQVIRVINQFDSQGNKPRKAVAHPQQPKVHMYEVVQGHLFRLHIVDQAA